MIRRLSAAAAAATLLAAGTAIAQEPAACLSPNPADWPAPSRPYFILLQDTSGSMLSCTNPVTNWPSTSCPSSAPRNSCGMEPTRINDAKCALRNTVLAFSGEVNFGLVTFGVRLSNCSAGTCIDTCTAADGSCNPPTSSTVGSSGEFYPGNNCVASPPPNPDSTASCGNTPACGGSATPPAPNLPANWPNGGNVLVPVLQDPTWGPTPPASNVPQLLEWFDGKCDNSHELFALGSTPLEGILRTAQEYLITGFNSNWSDTTYCNVSPLPLTFATPIDVNDRPCRSINLILVTDGSETCGGNAPSAATALYSTGITIGGKTFNVKTYVIGFAGADQTALNAIAAAGGTGTALSANNEADLSRGLSQIISGAIKPEICDNTDNNCNGCTDEGYLHYCNTRPTCCAWSTDQQRTYCLGVYNNTQNPNDLPCTTAQQMTEPLHWLCPDPGEVCDNLDNDCNGQIDEGFNKCGTPPVCPAAETCNGIDDDCDNIIDNAPGGGPYSACPNSCKPQPEVCDGCDNDCNGIADDGIAPIPCGFSPPANCQGTASCTPKTVTAPGACVTGGGTFGPCQNSPQPETCDGQDNDCNGTIDDNIPPTPCDVPNTTGLYYQGDNLSPPPALTFPQSQCKRGSKPCNGSCSGWVAPSTEICDGIDNDCNGIVDDGLTGGSIGQPCGVASTGCTQGTYQCVGGVVLCTGGSTQQPELCNGLDDNCNGLVDETPLQDAPPDPGCWPNPVPSTGCTLSCSYGTLTWCPPPNATCTGLGTLTAPCAPGTLVCQNGWKCQGGTQPKPEVCDGVDNDCIGGVDNGLGGAPCGSSVGECTPGTTACVGGAIICQNEGTPKPEVCNGLDDNCDGIIDNGVTTGGPCPFEAYDKVMYPGDRTQGLCRPGTTVCPTDVADGGSTCVGGIGPSPEVCDGKDNDCDGLIDEPGAPNDGIDGTLDPLDPTRRIGAACGTAIGECTQGTWMCQSGQFVCAGSKGPQPEICDCLDNNCNGQVDEEATDAGDAPLCATGKECVKSGSGAMDCQCAKPCGSGEFGCASPTYCKAVVLSSSGEVPTEGAQFCMAAPCPSDCSTQTVQQNGVVECAPAGTVIDGGGKVPQCVCSGTLFGCRSPCFNVQCDPGLACVLFGPSAGKCEPQNDCNFFGCPTGQACYNSTCVDDPCDPNLCAADQVCKPDATFTLQTCTASCATASCAPTQYCVNGACTDTGCSTPCAASQFCFQGTCQANGCGVDTGTYCASGQYCSPEKGTCIADPCNGVHCPQGQVCRGGECYFAPVDAGTDSGSTTEAGTVGTTTPPIQRGVFGLASGSGCGCRVAGDRNNSLALALASLVVAAGASRRRTRWGARNTPLRRTPRGGAR